MRKVLSLILAVLALTTPALADGPAAPTKLFQKIDGTVDREMIPLADDLMAKSAGGTLEKVTLLINSPGGDVLAGSIYIVALEVAKARGAKVVCYVPMLAASMAFQILAHCDERNVLAGALLLWHPPRVGLDQVLLTPDLAELLATELRTISDRLTGDLRARFPVEDEAFWYHFNAETLHTAEEVNVLSPGWLNIVADIPNAKAVMPGRGDSGDPGAYSPAAPWRFTYIWRAYE